MMYFCYFVSLLFLMFIFPPITVAAEDDVTKLNETQKQAMREIVRQVLNLDGKMTTINNTTMDTAKPDDAKLKSAKPRGRKTNKFPQHMLELYEKYTLQNIIGEEVIRSIEPSKDFVPHFKDLIVFNLSSISPTEKIKTAYLHIHRRKLSTFGKGAIGKKKMLPPPCRVRLFQILSSISPAASKAEGEKDIDFLERTKLRSLDSVLVTQVLRGGWHTIDISMALKEMFDSPALTSPAVFGVRFEGPKGKSISPQRFLKDMGNNLTSSFILVHSEESDASKTVNNDNKKNGLSDKKIKLIADMLENVERVTHIENAEDDTNISPDIDEETNNDNKRKLKKLKYYHTDPIRHERKYNRENKYKIKDIENDVTSETNRYVPIPGEGDIVELLNYDRVKKLNKLRRHNHKTINALNLRYDAASRKIVEKKKAVKSRHKKNESHSRRRSELSDVNMNESYNTKASADAAKQETRSKRSVNDDRDDEADDSYFIENNLNSKLFVTPTKRERELDSEDDMGDLSYDMKEAKPADILENTCKVDNLTINFSDIGFDFVILPHSFNLGVCSGSCQKNKIKKITKNIKNEDLIEEFLFQDISQYGIDNEKSSCVPDKKSSLEILYFDSENTVVFKSFKDVIVESCICR